MSQLLSINIEHKKYTYTKHIILFAMLIILLSNVYFSDDLEVTLGSLCSQLASLFKIVLMLTISLGVAAYALGQMMGAEMRARANVWSMGMIVAALVAAILYVLIPWLLLTIAKSSGHPIAKLNCNM